MKSIKKQPSDLASQLQKFSLGLHRKDIALEPYNQLWQQAFFMLENIIKDCLGTETSYQIEHIGSTSVSGLIAKPVLDVMVVFTNLKNLEKTIPLFQELGFAYKGDAIARMHGLSEEKNRRGFCLYDATETIKIVNLHLFTSTHSDVKKILAFRNKLRADAKLAKAYEKMKLNLSQNINHPYEYTRAKSAFIAEVLKGL